MTQSDSNKPADTPDWMAAAMQAHQDGRAFEADNAYAEVLRREPDNTQALRLRAILARDLGRIDAALDWLEKAVDIAPDAAEPRAELALTEMYTGDLEAAQRNLRKAHQLAPNSIDILTNLGALLQHRGHLYEAIALYREVLAQDPSETEVHCNLIKALSETGDFEGALSEASKAETHDSGAHVASTRAAVLIDAGEFRDALTTLEDERVAAQLDDIAHVNHAFCSLKLEAYDDAQARLQHALELNPHNSRAVADLINCLSRSGDHSAAHELATQFLGAHPGERLVIASLALAQQNAGRSSEARELTGCDHLVQVYDLPVDDLASLNAALNDTLTSDASQIRNPVSKATTGGAQTGEFDLSTGAAWQVFRTQADIAIRGTVDHFLRTGYAEHPVMQPASDHWSLRAWGTLLESGGYQSAHMHPLAWLSAVYYVSVPDDMNADSKDAGWLEFGAVPTHYYAADNPETTRFEPKEGRLIVFPSWFWHRTLPFSAESTRASIAFDVMPRAQLRPL